MSLEGASVHPDSSFLQFVWPFRFEPDHYDARVRTLDSVRWRGRKDPLDVWGTKSFPEEDLLPSVARYLNAPIGSASSARLLELTDEALRSPHGLGAGSADWFLSTPGGEIPFRLEQVQISLFRDGIGFLSVGLRPAPAAAAAWLDALHFFRFAAGQRRVHLRAERRTGPDTREPWFPRPERPEEPASAPPPVAPGNRTFRDVLEILLGTATLPEDRGPWWEEVFIPGQMLPWAALQFAGVPRDEHQRMLYRVHNFFHSRQEIHPSAEDLRGGPETWIPYADAQWFVFSLDGGAFVSFDPPDTEFFRRVMTEHLRTHYFLLFLLALEQRFALTALSDDVGAHWSASTDPERRERAMARIHERTLLFTARGYFPQAMQRDHHHRCYRRWQEVFQLERLYRAVTDGVREMHEHVMAERTHRMRELAEHAEARENAQQERWKPLRGLLEGFAAAFIGATLAWELVAGAYYFKALSAASPPALEPAGLRWIYLGKSLLVGLIGVVVAVTTRRIYRGLGGKPGAGHGLH